MGRGANPRGGDKNLLLQPANEVRGKVIFLHLSVILFTGVCYPSMHCRWYPSMPCNQVVCATPACLAAEVQQAGAQSGGPPPEGSAPGMSAPGFF